MKAPGFFLFSTEREAQGSWAQQPASESHGDFSKYAGRTYAWHYFSRVGNRARSTLFHSFLYSTGFRLLMCIIPCFESYGRLGKTDFYKTSLPSSLGR